MEVQRQYYGIDLLMNAQLLQFISANIRDHTGTESNGCGEKDRCPRAAKENRISEKTQCQQKSKERYPSGQTSDDMVHSKQSVQKRFNSSVMTGMHAKATQLLLMIACKCVLCKCVQSRMRRVNRLAHCYRNLSLGNNLHGMMLSINGKQSRVHPATP